MLFFEVQNRTILSSKVYFLNAALCMATVFYIEGRRLQVTVASFTLIIQIQSDSIHCDVVKKTVAL